MPAYKLDKTATVAATLISLAAVAAAAARLAATSCITFEGSAQQPPSLLHLFEAEWDRQKQKRFGSNLDKTDVPDFFYGS